MQPRNFPRNPHCFYSQTILGQGNLNYIKKQQKFYSQPKRYKQI